LNKVKETGVGLAIHVGKLLKKKQSQNIIWLLPLL
jgi:hypothetical protein